MKNNTLLKTKEFVKQLSVTKLVLWFVFLLSLSSIIYFNYMGVITAYGDSESHLNIAKRVISSPTPGFAQLGGIWLPLPHLLMIPFVNFDFLWRSGLAGSIVSSFAFIISALYIFKFVYFFTKNNAASYLGLLVFSLNANILYMQSTPMTEVLLIMFFILSTYYFVVFINDRKKLISLILAAFFGFCATLTRYDGWLLVGIEAMILFFLYLRNKFNKFYEGLFFLFSTLGFVGILIWFFWDWLILGDPLYFSNSPYSAKSQQQGWLARGELPTYHNIVNSVTYYSATVIESVGIVIIVLGILGLLFFLIDRKIKNKIITLLLFFVPFIFYVVTLFLGQSVIFIPSLTPESFEWNLFNVRYGIVMVPTIAILIGYFSNQSNYLKPIVLTFILFQSFLFLSGREKIITLEDGTTGLSASKDVDAEKYLASNYESGFVLLDDYARSVSILRSGLPMQNVIYIGNKPYWEESLDAPEKYAEWIVLQENDALWKNFVLNKSKEDRLYKYFAKVYTSNEILIFRRNNVVALKEKN